MLFLGMNSAVADAHIVTSGTGSLHALHCCLPVWPCCAACWCFAPPGGKADQRRLRAAASSAALAGAAVAIG